MTIGLIFDIQRFAIHDGPGIRTLVFFKGCPLRCLWCDNPESQAPYPEIASFESNCIKCGRCLETCPLKAIHLNNGAFTIDRGICNNCGKCTEVCYANAKKLIGRRMCIDDVLREIRKDTVFYRSSAGVLLGGETGGITLSGGEPLVQPTFVLELLRRCKQLDINTAMETSGHAHYENLRRISQYLDLLYFDLKHMDPVNHERLTGVSNEIILKNASRIAKEYAKQSKRMIIRVPLIPGCNDSQQNIESTAEFVNTLERVDRIELLTYHKFGQHKYKRLGREYQLENLSSPGEEDVQELKRCVESRGLHVQIVGSSSERFVSGTAKDDQKRCFV